MNNWLQRFIARCVAGENEKQTEAILKAMAESETAMKINELAAKFGEMNAQVEKIWAEQQTRYNTIMTQLTALQALLENQELTAEATAALETLTTSLKAFDDAIPD